MKCKLSKASHIELKHCVHNGLWGILKSKARFIVDKYGSKSDLLHKSQRKFLASNFTNICETVCGTCGKYHLLRHETGLHYRSI
jgi:hypothetical protein